MVGSGFCLDDKKKHAAFPTRESSFSPFLFEDIQQFLNELQKIAIQGSASQDYEEWIPRL